MKSGPAEALERFRALEDGVGRMLEALQHTKMEKGAAEKQLAEARRHIERLEKDLDGLRKERSIVRGRVQSLIESIATFSEKPLA